MPDFLVYEPSLPPLESEGGLMSGFNRSLTVHFGFPEVSGGSGVVGRLVRWRLPLDMEDLRGGTIGARSLMWHPARTLAESGMGADGRDFACEGLPDENVEDDF